MLVVVLAMILIVATAGLVATYVAYPARGRQLPRAPWLGDALARGANRMGLVDDDDAAHRAIEEDSLSR